MFQSEVNAKLKIARNLRKSKDDQDINSISRSNSMNSIDNNNIDKQGNTAVMNKTKSEVTTKKFSYDDNTLPMTSVYNIQRLNQRSHSKTDSFKSPNKSLESNKKYISPYSQYESKNKKSTERADIKFKPWYMLTSDEFLLHHKYLKTPTRYEGSVAYIEKKCTSFMTEIDMLYESISQMNKSIDSYKSKVKVLLLLIQSTKQQLNNKKNAYELYQGLGKRSKLRINPKHERLKQESHVNDMNSTKSKNEDNLATIQLSKPRLNVRRSKPSICAFVPDDD